MKCDVCGQEAPLMRAVAGVRICMACNPFCRCTRKHGVKPCLGILVHKPTPSDMGRRVCDKCGKVALKRDCLNFGDA